MGEYGRYTEYKMRLQSLLRSFIGCENQNLLKRVNFESQSIKKNRGKLIRAISTQNKKSIFSYCRIIPTKNVI